MLSKSNKMLIGCLALLLAMSVGYALFSDTITVNGSATAKGDFEITTESVDLNEEIYSNLMSEGVSNGIVENPTINVVNNVVTSSVTLGAPGSHQYFGIKVTNTGSIPAKLSSIIDKTNNRVIVDKSLEAGTCDIAWFNVNDTGTGLNAVLNTEDGWAYDYDVEVPIQDRMLQEDFCTDTLDAVLDPGEETYYFVKYYWGSRATEQSEALNLNWQLEINFEQITN